MGRIPLKAEYLRLVNEAMVDVTHPGGTASVAGANAPYLFAGKTGTAQVVGIRQGEKYDASRLVAHNRDHALFIGFAPANNPKIVVAVMVDEPTNGSYYGGQVAAPAFEQIGEFALQHLHIAP